MLYVTITLFVKAYVYVISTVFINTNINSLIIGLTFWNGALFLLNIDHKKISSILYKISDYNYYL